MNEDFNPAELNRRDMDRLKGYKELLDFYQGVHWEGRERRGEKRLTFNYAKVFIDKVTSYLMSGIHFAVEPVEDTDEAKARAEKAEAAIYPVYEDNNLEQLDTLSLMPSFWITCGVSRSRSTCQVSMVWLLPIMAIIVGYLPPMVSGEPS